MRRKRVDGTGPAERNEVAIASSLLSTLLRSGHPCRLSGLGGHRRRLSRREAPVSHDTRGISKPERGVRAKNEAACSSPTICSCSGSHEMARLSRAAIAQRWQVFMA